MHRLYLVYVHMLHLHKEDAQRRASRAEAEASKFKQQKLEAEAARKMLVSNLTQPSIRLLHSIPFLLPTLSNNRIGHEIHPKVTKVVCDCCCSSTQQHHFPHHRFAPWNVYRVFLPTKQAKSMQTVQLLIPSLCLRSQGGAQDH